MALELTRRMLLGCAGCGVLGAAAGLAMPTVAPAVHSGVDNKTNLTPKQALALLKEGNARLHAQHQGGDLLDNAVRENVQGIVMRLRASPEPILLEPLQARRLKIVGARYDLEDGTIDWFLEN